LTLGPVPGTGTVDFAATKKSRPIDSGWIWAAATKGMRDTPAKIRAICNSGPVVSTVRNVDPRGPPEVQDLGLRGRRCDSESKKYLREAARRQHAEHLAPHKRTSGRLLVIARAISECAVIHADRRAVGKGRLSRARRPGRLLSDNQRRSLAGYIADLVLAAFENLLGISAGLLGPRTCSWISAAIASPGTKIAATKRNIQGYEGGSAGGGNRPIHGGSARGSSSA